MELEYKLNTKGNPNVLALAADASVEADVKSLVEQSVEKFGSIDYFDSRGRNGYFKAVRRIDA